MAGRWPQRLEYCPGMRARHGVGHGVESQTWPFRSAPCLPIQQVRHRAIVRSATAAALRPRAQHEKACGYVDNARALPTSSQATAKTAKPCLIAYEPGRGQIRIRHPPRRLDGAQPLSYQAITPTMRRCWQPFTRRERCVVRKPFGHQKRFALNGNAACGSLGWPGGAPFARERSKVRSLVRPP